MYDDDHACKEAKKYWGSSKGSRSCVDFIGPLRRGTLNLLTEAIQKDAHCSSAMAAGLHDMTAARISVRDPASWTIDDTRSLTLETPTDFVATSLTEVRYLAQASRALSYLPSSSQQRTPAVGMPN